MVLCTAFQWRIAGQLWWRRQPVTDPNLGSVPLEQPGAAIQVVRGMTTQHPPIPASGDGCRRGKV